MPRLQLLKNNNRKPDRCADQIQNSMHYHSFRRHTMQRCQITTNLVHVDKYCFLAFVSVIHNKMHIGVH